MLVQRRRRWANIKSALDRYLVFAVVDGGPTLKQQWANAYSVC